MASEEEEEDDYLSMTFDDQAAPAAKETSLQRTARLKKEAAARSRVPSKNELAARATAAREQALATAIDSSNKGAQMLAKMGFKGGALGKTPDARARPIELQMKLDRGGIGMDTEKKRKIQEAADATADSAEKRTKVFDENEYRARNRAEVEERRLEGQMWGAMRVLERLETHPAGMKGGAKSQSDGNADAPSKETAGTSMSSRNPPLKGINVLWRPLVKQRLENERDRRMRYDLDQSLSRRKDYNDPEADAEDRLAFGTEVQEELDETDDELEALEQKPTAERVDELVKCLREKYHYCFWCKYQYPDGDLEGCPGTTEDEHG